MGYNKRFSTSGVQIIWKLWAPKKLMHIFCDPDHLYQSLWKALDRLRGEKKEKICEIVLKVQIAMKSGSDLVSLHPFVAAVGCKQPPWACKEASWCTYRGCWHRLLKGPSGTLAESQYGRWRRVCLFPHINSSNKRLFAFGKNRQPPISLELWGTGQYRCFFILLSLCLSRNMKIEEIQNSKCVLICYFSLAGT